MIIFCIPAGGANPFQVWKKMINKEKTIYVLDFPGRGSRVREPFIDDMTQLVKNMADEIIKNNLHNEPYSIFGYCFGAVIGYEVCKLLKKENKQLPEYFITFGSAAPNCRNFKNKIKKTDTQEFKKMVSQFLSPIAVGSEEEAANAQQAYIVEYEKKIKSGSEITVENVFRNLNDDNEFEMQMMLDLLNGSMNQIEQDDNMLSNYYLNDNNIEILDVNAKVLCGKEDSFAAEDDVLAWQDCFNTSEVIYVSGDHYSIMNYPQVFVDILNNL